MKLQHFSIIFLIIFLPIMLILSNYIDTQIQLLVLRDNYTKSLISSTHDAMSAYEINTMNDEYSDNTTSKKRNVQASINTFFRSMSNNLGVAGYTEQYVQPYIPAIVFTGYDGYYIYAKTTTTPRYTKAEQDAGTGEEEGNIKPGEATSEYNLKPYIYYSAEYIDGQNTDVIINYTLDNYITVYGKIGGQNYNTSGYIFENTGELQDGEKLSENITAKIKNVDKEDMYLEIKNCPYYYAYDFTSKTFQKVYCIHSENTKVKINGDELDKFDDVTNDDEEFSIPTNIYHSGFLINSSYLYFTIDSSGYFSAINGSNIEFIGNISVETYDINKTYILSDTVNGVSKVNNISFIDGNLLKSLMELEVRDMVVNDTNGRVRVEQIGDSQNPYAIYKTNQTKIFETKDTFNDHRQEIIKMSIQENLKSALANYSTNSGDVVYKLPILTQSDWDKIFSNISIIAFMQDMPIGNSTYNSYAIATSSGNKEYVPEDGIYFVDTTTNTYHRITCSKLTGVDPTNLVGYKAADFKKNSVSIDEKPPIYYYPQHAMACYECIENSKYGDSSKISNDLKKVYNTALSREKAVQYKTTTMFR